MKDPFNQSPPELGNQFDEDRVLQSYLRRVLPREVLNSEIASIKNMGVRIKTNVHIDSIDELFEGGYEAVLVAVGKHKSQELSIPGADSEGVFLCAEFLRSANAGEAVNIGRNVVVLGGGNAG